MSSCINKKTVHKQEVKWVHRLFKTSQCSGWRLGSVFWTLRLNHVKVMKAHFEKSRAANISPPAWKSCFSSKTFWNYETSHQIRMEYKKHHLNFVSTNNKCKYFNPIPCTDYCTFFFLSFFFKKKENKALKFNNLWRVFRSRNIFFFFWKLN